MVAEVVLAAWRMSDQWLATSAACEDPAANSNDASKGQRSGKQANDGHAAILTCARARERAGTRNTGFWRRARSGAAGVHARRNGARTRAARVTTPRGEYWLDLRHAAGETIV
jgi:hypothetical protein